MAPALQAGGGCRHSGRHHRPPRRQRSRHPRPCRRRQRQGRRGAGRADHEALPGRRQRHEPAGPARRQPAIDRNKGLHNVLDTVQDKYKFVFEETANFDAREGPVGHRVGARRHGRRRRTSSSPANDDMALGAIEALKGRNSSARSRSSASTRCRRRWPQIRDGTLTATIEQFPGGQSRGAVETLVSVPARGQEAGSRWCC